MGRGLLPMGLQGGVQNMFLEDFIKWIAGFWNDRSYAATNHWCYESSSNMLYTWAIQCGVPVQAWFLRGVWDIYLEEFLKWFGYVSFWLTGFWNDTSVTVATLWSSKLSCDKFSFDDGIARWGTKRQFWGQQKNNKFFNQGGDAGILLTGLIMK